MTTSIQTMIPYEELDDSHLARNALTDADSFAELYRRHVTRIYRYHMAHTGSVKDAEDLTSQTFMAALEGLASFRGSGSFTAWIFGIAARKRALFFRSLKPQVDLDEALQVPMPEEDTAHQVDQRLRHATIIRALKQLSRDRAESIILTYFGGLGYEESAQVLGKNPAAVKMLVSRGLSDLRERSALLMEVAE